jgi:selenocysteine lyase/cysteine desulfurase
MDMRCSASAPPPKMVARHRTFQAVHTESDKRSDVMNQVDAITARVGPGLPQPRFMPAWIRSQLIGRETQVPTPFGKRRITYADHVASGRSLQWVEDFIAAHVLPMYANTHTEDSATGACMTALAQDASRVIKASLGASDCKLLFCGTGCTAAIRRLQEILGLVVPEAVRAQVIDAVGPSGRPLVFVGPYEHHSNEVSWRETIAEVVELPLDPDGALDVAALAAALDDTRASGRPLIGSFSAASNVTGVLTDTRAIARLLHSRGALACFDFAAGAPHLDIDMRKGQPDGYDAVFLSAHKFVGGPGAPGILAFDPALYRLRAPSVAGGGTVSYVSAQDHCFVDDIEQREEAGTPGTVQRIRAALAFMVRDAVGIPTISKLEGGMIRAAIARLRRHPRIELLGNLEAPRLPILSFLVRSRDGRQLHPRLVTRLLNDLFGIQARAGCACAGPYAHRLLGIGAPLADAYRDAVLRGYQVVKPGWTRINFSYFIEEAERDFLQDAIEFIADHGERFIAEYRCEWQTGAWQHPRDGRQPGLVEMAAQPLTTLPPGAPAQTFQDCLRSAHAMLSSMPKARRAVEAPLPVGLPASLVSFCH